MSNCFLLTTESLLILDSISRMAFLLGFFKHYYGMMKKGGYFICLI